MKKLMLFALAAVIAAAALAGWVHVPGGPTVWTPEPTVATCWGRDGQVGMTNLHPVFRVVIFDNTIRTMTSSSTVEYATGFWIMRPDGSVGVNPSLTTEMYGRRSSPHALTDIEWDLRTNGTIYPKR